MAERPTTAAGDLSSVVDEALAPDPESLLPPEDQTDIERGGGLLDNPQDLTANQGLGGFTWWQIAIGVVLLVLAGLTLFAAGRYNRRVEGDIDRSYLRLGDWSRWLGVPWRATQTPYEQADSLVATVPDGQKPVRNLTRQYVLQRFSPTKATDEDFDPRQEWRELRPVLLKQSLTKMLNRSQKTK